MRNLRKIHPLAASSHSHRPTKSKLKIIKKKTNYLLYWVPSDSAHFLPPPGLLRLPLCDELPQPDRHIRPSGNCQAEAGQILLHSLGSGRPAILFPPYLDLDNPNSNGYHLTPPHQIKQRHPTVKVKYLSSYCFSGTYILTLLTEGYNFTSESYYSINYIKQVSTAPPAPFPISRSPAPCPIPK